MEQKGRPCKRHNETEYLLRTISHRFKRIMDGNFQKYELTGVQANILFYLNFQEDAPIQKDLENYFQVSHSAITGILSRLKEKNMVDFVDNPKDKRCKCIIITDKGKLLVKTIIKKGKALHDTTFSNFSTEEKDTLTALLKKMLTNIEDIEERKNTADDKNITLS